MTVHPSKFPLLLSQKRRSALWWWDIWGASHPVIWVGKKIILALNTDRSSVPGTTCKFSLLPRVRWENWYHSYSCMLSIELKPRGSWPSLVWRDHQQGNTSKFKNTPDLSKSTKKLNVQKGKILTLKPLWWEVTVNPALSTYVSFGCWKMFSLSWI